jgi:tellurite methyltransferase
MDYDREYSRNENYFSSEPEQVLSSNFKLIPESLPVLDIGAGQGRHSLFLARHGYDVTEVFRKTCV